jgi:hypothetical protein
VKNSQLELAVQSVTGMSFIGLDTLTEVTLKGGKKNPMQGRVTKRMFGANVMAFSNKNGSGYEAMVQRRLIAEGKDPEDFVLGPRSWGVRLPEMPIVAHEKDGVMKYYLEVIFLTPGKTEYRLDGVVVPKASIEGLADADGGEQGGLDNKVHIRCFAADSITELRVDHKVFN